MLSRKKEPDVKYHKDGYDPYLCASQGKVPLISQPGVHPLHIFLLVLAVFHVLYSVGTMALGQAKYEFGFSSCFHENLPATVARVLFGVALQIVCSYITFPLYAWVTQEVSQIPNIYHTIFQKWHMGSHMKKAILEEQTAKALKQWQQTARERKKLRRAGADVSVQLVGGRNTPSRGSSPIHLLHKNKPKPRASDIGSVLHSTKVT
ncbi:hypothetical protein PVL29_027115 [Vitis rotundifolia]|uniref:Uncharacterized protein n=1 Tax=Vitis rotundifolia TaxID=103349 RepID=A0AA38YIB9_VITRO|nr:hypothetical protein PVL29_027115 [Vitis rotundifolia]